MKRSFTGPFWLLLVFGLLQVLSISYWLYEYFGSVSNSFLRSQLTMARLAGLFMWPAIILGEALVYWLIRQRNSFRALSWAHTVIFILAFLVNIFISFVATMHYRVVDVNDRVNQQNVARQQQYLFYGLVLLAHLAFVAMLANCFRKMPPAEEGAGQGQENILDDVVL